MSGNEEAARGGGRGRGIRLPGLRRAREERALTVSELEAESGVARSTISYLEDGERGARGQTVRTLARALGVQVTALTRDPGEAVAGDGGDASVGGAFGKAGMVAGEGIGSGEEKLESYEVLEALAPQRAAAEGISKDEALGRLVHEQVLLARAERRRKPPLRPLESLPRAEGANNAAAAVLADRG